MNRWTLLVAAILLGGCLRTGEEPVETTEPEPTPLADPGTSFRLPYNATQCREGVLVLLVEFAQAQKSLPKGYKARDARDIFGLPIASGKAAVYMNANGCTQYELAPGGVDEGTFGVFVEPPKVAGSRPASLLDFYEVGHYTSKEELLMVLRAVNHSVEEGVIGVTINAQPGGAFTGSGEVRNDEGQVAFTFGMTAPIGDQTFKGIGRFWQDTSNSTVLFEYSVDTKISQGYGSCSARTAKVQAVFGTTSCPAGQSFVVVIPNFKWTASVQQFLGVHAE